MPTPRSEIGLAFDERRIFVAGGIGLTGWTDAFEMFDAGSAQWTELAPLPGPRHHLALTYLDGGVFAGGGYSNLAFTMTDTFWRYDRENLSWEKRAPMPEPRAAFTLVSTGRAVYALGGEGPRSDEVWRYDPPADEWVVLEQRIPTLREHHASVVLDGIVFVIGGRWKDVNLATVDTWEPATGEWSSIPSMPTARGGIAATVYKGRIHVFGGEDLRTGCVFDRHEVFDLASSAWTELAPLPTPRHGLQAAALDGRHWVIGGGSRAGVQTLFAARGIVEAYGETRLRH